MLNKDKYYSNAEEEILNNIPKSIKYIQGQMQSVLDEKMKSQSVVNDSLNSIDPNMNYNTMQGNLNNNVNSNPVQTQDKVRVRTLETPVKSVVPPVAPVDNNYINNQNYANIPNYNGGVNYGNNGESNYSQGSMNGVSTTSILLLTVVFIALVFLVSTAMFMYFGLK